MRALTRSLIATPVALALVALFIWTMPVVAVEPCGIMLPKNGAFPPVAGPIQLFDSLSAPLDAQDIGTVTMMYHTASQGREAQEILFNAMNQKVTAQGGGAVELQQFFFIPSEAASGPGLYFKGKVLRLSTAAN